MPAWNLAHALGGGQFSHIVALPGLFYDYAKYSTNVQNTTVISQQVTARRLSRVVLSAGAYGLVLPADGQDIEIRVLSGLPPSSATPLYLEMTAGQFLKNCYDGIYSPNSPAIRYDPVVMAQLVTNTPILRAIITQTEKDGKTWLEENWYKVYGYIPWVNRNGEISPFKWDLPDVSVSLANLDDTNVKSATWHHGTQDAVTEVDFTYKRDFLTTGKTFSSIDVHPDIISAPGTTLVGQKPVTYTPQTVRDINFKLGGDFGPQVLATEIGYSLFKSRVAALFDRFSIGASRLIVEAYKSSADVRGLEEGRWVVVGVSWLITSRRSAA